MNNPHGGNEGLRASRLRGPTPPDQRAPGLVFPPRVQPCWGQQAHQAHTEGSWAWSLTCLLGCTGPAAPLLLGVSRLQPPRGPPHPSQPLGAAPEEVRGLGDHVLKCEAQLAVTVEVGLFDDLVTHQHHLVPVQLRLGEPGEGQLQVLLADEVVCVEVCREGVGTLRPLSSKLVTPDTSPCTLWGYWILLFSQPGPRGGSPTRHLWTPRSTDPHSPSAQTPSTTASTHLA